MDWNRRAKLIHGAIKRVHGDGGGRLALSYLTFAIGHELDPLKTRKDWPRWLAPSDGLYGPGHHRTYTVRDLVVMPLGDLTGVIDLQQQGTGGPQDMRVYDNVPIKVFLGIDSPIATYDLSDGLDIEFLNPYLFRTSYADLSDFMAVLDTILDSTSTLSSFIGPLLSLAGPIAPALAVIPTAEKWINKLKETSPKYLLALALAHSNILEGLESVSSLRDELDKVKTTGIIPDEVRAVVDGLLDDVPNPKEYVEGLIENLPVSLDDLLAKALTQEVSGCPVQTLRVQPHKTIEILYGEGPGKIFHDRTFDLEEK